ncbi:phage tail tube protein [Pragia fontium]|uniref:phage tail tube protein n=1 Tax=Pragia fontium TaxID=82985 RepID=UPI00064B66BD|nr:phage tail tube protein [Pragia fontium]AKJ41553.1 hypothetical protein QQ39_05210 [Pragia fontium]
MASKFEKSQGTKVNISKLPVSVLGETTDADFVGLSCSVKSVSLNRGEKTDIDITTLCSTEQESTPGLPAPGELTLDSNFSGDDLGQKTLEDSYNNSTVHEYKVELPSGHGWRFLGEVRTAPIEIGSNAVATSNYTVRIRGSIQRITPQAPITKVSK